MSDTQAPKENGIAPGVAVDSLMRLPTELHLHIASYLPYPDALALKHTCRHFYSLVYTGVHLKVDWLVERYEKKLECPMEKCSFRTDEAFCNWRIRRIMERRRRHLECRPGRGGCLVIEGRSCHRGMVPVWLKREGRIKLLGSWAFWRHEVLVIGLLFLFYTLLWNLLVRYLFTTRPDFRIFLPSSRYSILW
ncbi:hypothetical protein VTN96DRAFT_7332 [Rasamsonia emersonii]